MVNLLWPEEVDPEEALTGGDSKDEDEDAAALVASERRLRRTMQLGSGLPTAGSLLATLGSGPGSQTTTTGLSPGDGYSIEARRTSFLARLFLDLALPKHVLLRRFS